MYTQPQLEIYADDVKCSHGATVGQLDENALFYMQQRGISLKEARLLPALLFLSFFLTLYCFFKVRSEERFLILSNLYLLCQLLFCLFEKVVPFFVLPY